MIGQGKTAGVITRCRVSIIWGSLERGLTGDLAVFVILLAQASLDRNYVFLLQYTRRKFDVVEVISHDEATSNLCVSR